MYFNSNRLIRHWNKTNFITICLNFKLELTEHIRNRNSIFMGLVYTSVYWLRLYIRCYENKDIKNVVLYRVYQEYLFQALVFWVSKSGFIYRVESCKYLYPAVNFIDIYVCIVDLIRWQIYITHKYLFLKCSRVWLLTIPISHVFTYRSSLIKNIKNTGYFTHSKES